MSKLGGTVVRWLARSPGIGSTTSNDTDEDSPSHNKIDWWTNVSYMLQPIKTLFTAKLLCDTLTQWDLNDVKASWNQIKLKSWQYNSKHLNIYKHRCFHVSISTILELSLFFTWRIFPFCHNPTLVTAVSSYWESFYWFSFCWELKRTKNSEITINPKQIAQRSILVHPNQCMSFSSHFCHFFCQ